MTEVALDTATPHAPSVIRLLLDKLGVAYREVVEHPQLPAASRVQAVLVDDEVGAMMVLFPQSQLLDLDRLAELTGRKLTAVSVPRLKQMLDKHQLKALPGIPGLTSSPCQYEKSLLGVDTVYIQSGEAGLLLEIEHAHFKRMLAKASASSFGQDVEAINPNLDRPDDDTREISQAVQAFTARRIQKRLEETIEIPPLADTAQKIIKLRVDPNASIDDITGVVETDPALAAQVVSWAASPYYASPGKIRSVEDAIVRVLGFDLVINLALGLALGKTLSLPKDQPQQATPYWQQSIYTAAIIEGLTRAMPRAERPEAGLTYLAGLLHNFGYLLLAHVFPPHFSLICRHLEVNPHLNHTYVEQHLLGISREQIGAWLMKLWDMPEELSTALRFQHDPAYDGEYSAFPNLVCLATRLLRARGIGSGPQEEIPDQLLERLGITRDKADDAVNKVLEAESLLRELASQFHAPH
ncbi:HDOD domain-containing protein [Pseudomonas sp. Leaf58]|uniref:aminoacyl-tRNA deacylase and HDOD domain-containing protein n=1 Tax=Pseudomonas TaxID=286 RepID=UPI0007001C38|nr:aminoacyl-tRNA deacylase and HDOD domain-containing protein [Pseudomonas sp. Leaf58]AYG47339.1 HDOD domain-containing protein [Pseudomonas sp. Leaf58]KQN66215.1 histidine kinase [Pseudomonas sp. Leaf58]